MSKSKLDAFWMPYTANRQFKANPRMISAAEGAYYVTDDSRRVFDSLSGLWTTGAGHNRPEIRDAVAVQLDTLDYSPAFQFGHPLAFELAERIAELAPDSLDQVFSRIRVRIVQILQQKLLAPIGARLVSRPRPK